MAMIAATARDILRRRRRLMRRSLRREVRHAQAIPGHHRLAALGVSRRDYSAMTCRSRGEDDYLMTYSAIQSASGFRYESLPMLRLVRRRVGATAVNTARHRACRPSASPAFAEKS